VVFYFAHVLSLTVRADNLLGSQRAESDIRKVRLLYRRNIMAKLQTTGGYEYEEPNLEGRGDVAINLSYAEAYDIILGALRNEASLQPLDETTFQANAENILGLLIDAASEDNDETSFDEEYRGN
jgi:hypothetical protein